MFLTGNSGRGGLKAAPAILIALLLLLAALPVFAGDDGDTMHSFVDYRNGVLYAFHISNGDPVSIRIPAELKVTGQVLESTWDSVCVAKFRPATGGDYDFREKRGYLSFDLIIVHLAGKGEITCKVGSEEWVIPIDSHKNKLFDIKLPDFEIDYDLPYSVSATGNIKLTKTFSGESDKGYAHRDVWQYTAGGILEGTMTFQYEMPKPPANTEGKWKGPTFTFPFCPGSAYYWIKDLPSPKDNNNTPIPKDNNNTSIPGGDRGKNKLAYLLIPAALILLLLPLARAVNVSVGLEPAESGAQAVIFRDARGPEKIRVVLNVNSRPFEQELILRRNESQTVDIEGIGYVQATIRTPGRRNVSKNTRAELLIRSETDGRNQDH